MNIGNRGLNDGYTTKNYTEQGGDITHIGGLLVIDPGGRIEGAGLPSQAQAQNDSEATTIAALKEDFNSLLQKLRNAGILSDEQESDIR